MTGCSMAAKRMGNDLIAGKQKIGDISNSMKTATASTKALGVAMNVFTNVGFMLAITAVTKVVTELAQAQSKAVESTKEATNAYKDELISLEEYKTKVAELHEELNSETISYEDSKTIREELLVLQDELIEKYGNEKTAIENITSAIKGEVDALDELNEKAYRDWLAKADEKTFWNISGKSGLDQAIDYMETDQTVSFFDMQNANLSDELQEIQKEIDETIRAKYGLEKQFATFKITGTPEEIRKQLEDIRQDYVDISENVFLREKLAGDWDKYREEAIDSINEVLLKLDDGLEKHQETYQTYIEGMIKYDSEYSDEYATILQKRAELESSQNSGNKEAIQKARQEFMDAINKGIEESGSNENIRKYFESLYPELQAEFSDWAFEFDLQANVKGLKDVANEIDEQYTAVDLLDMVNTEGIQEGEESFNTLIDKAYEYGVITDKSAQEVQKLIDLLVALGYVKGNVKDETFNNEITVLKSFESAWTSLKVSEDEATKDLANNLIELAEAGRLSVETFNEADSTGYFENVGISAEKAVEQINNLVDASTQLSTLSGQISKMSDMLADKKNGTVASADDLAGFDAEVRGLDSWEDFEQVLGSTTSTMAQCQQAADNLATEWLNSGNYLENLNDKNKQYYITQMENMGIENAEIIVTNTLTQKKKEQAAMEEFLTQRKKETGDASYNLAKATAEEIKKFAEEKGWSETTTYALLELALKKKLVNGTTLDFSSDIASIYNYVKAINGAAGALKTLADIKSGKESRNYSPDAIKAIYESSQNELDNALKTLEDAKLNATTVDVSPTGSSTYSPSKSSTDNTKEEAGEVFDFIEIRLQNLMDMASKAKDKIDDLLSFGSKRKQTIQAINKTTKAIKAEIKAAKEYAKYADKVAKEAASDTSTSSTEKITSTVGKTIAQEAQKYVGVLPYVYGGKSLTSGADCSGFVQSLYAQYGISIPRVSSDQWNDSNATYVAKEDLQAGDLVFFASGGSASNPGHVGLYIGNGKMVHEPQEGEKAKISSIDWVDYVGGKHYASLGNSYGTNTTTTTKKTYSNKELERYKKLVRQGLISDDAIKTIKDENLSKAISDYKDWYEKSQDCIESIEALTDSLKELYETLAQNPIEKAADRVEDLDNAIELRNAQQENLKVSQTKQYKNLNDKNITAYKKEEKAYKIANNTANKNLKTANKKYNSAKSNAVKYAKKSTAKSSGLTPAELKKLRAILKAGEKIVPAKYLAKITDKKLMEKCQEYNQRLIAKEKYTEAKETANQNYALAKEETKRKTAETQKDTFDQIQENYENKIYKKERKSQQAQNKLDLREAQGKYANAEQLKIQLSAEEDKLKLLEEEETKLRTQLKLIPEGTPEWYEAKEALAGVVDEQNECLVTQEEINDAINNIPIDKLNDAIEEFESLRSVISSTIELLEKRYRNVSSSLYEKDIEYIKGEISKNKGLAELYRRQYEEEVAKGNDQAASEALVNWKNAESTSNSLYSAMEDTYDAIWQNELSAYENIATKIEYAQSNIQSLLGIIQDEMLVDNDTGELTDYGLAKESLYLEQFGNANEEVSTYKAELAELEEMWANGQSGLSENEYLEKKAELYQNLTDAVNDQVSAVQALIDITEQQMQAELNALKEVIDARVEALNEKKAYYDYDKNIRSQTKDIQSLDNQIAALKSAEDTYENRKELKLLEAQRQEAQEQLDETQLDHQIELLTNGLNDFYDEISEEYDDYIQELKSSTEAQHELVQTIKGAVASVPEIVEQATEAALATYGLQGTNILRDTDWQKSVPEQQVTKEEEIQPDLSVLDDENTDSTNSNTTAVNTNTTAVNSNTTAVNDLTTAINSLNSSGSGNVESVTLDAKAVYFGAVASEVTGGGITGSVDWSGTAKFATGGIVRSGISDRTNDKLLVRVNPDETILTKDFTDMLPTTVDIMKDLVKMPTVVPTTYSNSPVVNVSYDNLIRIDGNADSNTIAEVKKLMPEIVRQTSTSIARQMKRNGF